MSAPAENARSPRPRSTTARTSSPKFSSALQSVSMIPALTALTGGLSSQTVSITPEPLPQWVLAGRRGQTAQRSPRKGFHDPREHLAELRLLELADARLRDLGD